MSPATLKGMKIFRVSGYPLTAEALRTPRLRRAAWSRNQIGLKYERGDRQNSHQENKILRSYYAENHSFIASNAVE